MKHLLTILMFISFLPTTASAGYINDRVDWEALGGMGGGSGKQPYVMGLLDMHLQQMFDDSQLTKDLIEHRAKCLLKMKMNPSGLVDLVDTMYQNDISIWSLPPASVLIQGLHKMCGEP